MLLLSIPSKFGCYYSEIESSIASQIPNHDWYLKKRSPLLEIFEAQKNVKIDEYRCLQELPKRSQVEMKV